MDLRDFMDLMDFMDQKDFMDLMDLMNSWIGHGFDISIPYGYGLELDLYSCGKWITEWIWIMILIHLAPLVLGARIVGMNSEKLRTFNGCVNLPPVPTPYTFTKIHSEVLTAAEEESSMERATMELKSQFPIDPITNCVYVPASIDGTYNSSACFSSIISTKTGKALAYKVASNSCSTCSLYNNATLTER